MKKLLLVFAISLSQISCSAPTSNGFDPVPISLDSLCLNFFMNSFKAVKYSNDKRKIAFIYQTTASGSINTPNDIYYLTLYIVNTDGTNLKLIKQFSDKDKPVPYIYESQLSLFWSEDSNKIYIKDTTEKKSYRLFSLDGEENELDSDLSNVKLLDPQSKFAIIENKNNPDKKELIYTDRNKLIESKEINVDLSFLGLDNYSNLKIQLLDNKKVYITKIPDFSSSKKDPFLFYAIGDLNFNTGEIKNIDVFRKSYTESPYYLEVIKFTNSKLYYLFDRKIYEYDLVTKKETMLGEENILTSIKNQYYLNKPQIYEYEQNLIRESVNQLRAILKKLDLPKPKEYPNCK